jgi:hypothetical protein
MTLHELFEAQAALGPAALLQDTGHTTLAIERIDRATLERPNARHV